MRFKTGRVSMLSILVGEGNMKVHPPVDFPAHKFDALMSERLSFDIRRDGADYRINDVLPFHKENSTGIDSYVLRKITYIEGIPGGVVVSLLHMGAAQKSEAKRILGLI